MDLLHTRVSRFCWVDTPMVSMEGRKREDRKGQAKLGLGPGVERREDEVLLLSAQAVELVAMEPGLAKKQRRHFNVDERLRLV